jgi:hypothetical protein
MAQNMNIMKLIQNAPNIAKALILTGMLGACQNEKVAVVNPLAEQNQRHDFQNFKISAESKLIKDASRVLAYSGPRNLLTKETLESYNYYIEYAYNGQSISGTRYQISTKNQVEKNVYTLNANGLCIESIVGNNFKVTTVYEYNENQQLIKAYNKSEPNERLEFDYSDETNGQAMLLSVTFYDKANLKIKELSYSYAGLTPDIYPVNPEYLAAGTTKYLPIFGRFSPYLVKMVTEKEFTYHPFKEYASARLYAYTQYADGKVKSIKATDVKSGNTYSSTERQYSSAMASN